MRLKKEIKEKIERAFDELILSGYAVGTPIVDVSTRPIYTYGKSVPATMTTDIKVTISIGLTEKDIEMDK